ncbi:Gfo/Idh/MocA family oxidoreductase, partial [bacterium]|nr:Gfo/Idh/MocA family oxidoreductase [bacterium]
MGKSMNRRTFVKTGVAAGLAMTMTRNIRLFGTEDKKVRLGIIGVGSRGTGLLKIFLKREDVEVPAVCDIRKDRVARAQRLIERSGRKKPEEYSRGEEDFRRMVLRDDLDGVVIATPWRWHTPMAVAAMKAGKYAATEVPAAVTIDECWKLVNTYENTGIHCMFLENVCYSRNILAVLKMVRMGLFGELSHCECGYLHDTRYVMFGPEGELLWRAKHLLGRNCNFYPTHPIGPTAHYLNINCGNKFDYLVSMSSKALGLEFYARKKFGADHPSAKINYTFGDINNTIIKCYNGETVSLIYDTVSSRSVAHRYSVQGTKGIWELARDEIYLEDRSPKKHKWEPFNTYQEKYEHPLWKKYYEEAMKT